MDFKKLDSELQERAFACKTMDELIAFAQETGVEFTAQEFFELTDGIDWSASSATAAATTASQPSGGSAG